MFVGMWMTRELITVDPAATLAHIAATMARRKIRRLPVVNVTPDGPQLLGIVTHSDVLHAFPADINPFAANAADSIAAFESSGRQSRVYAADLMARDPLVTAPDAPIESAARLMRDHKIGALPVVSQHPARRPHHRVGHLPRHGRGVRGARPRRAHHVFAEAGRRRAAAGGGHRAPPRACASRVSWRCRATSRRCAWCSWRARRSRRRWKTCGSRSHRVMNVVQPRCRNGQACACRPLAT